MTDFLPLSTNPKTQRPQVNLNRGKEAAQKLEATFLAEMLKAAGFGTQENSFSGGAGEDQFASFHRQMIADQMAASGGIGLAEHFLKSMMETKDDG